MRKYAGALLAALALTVLTACDSSGSDASESAGWTFTDGRGEKINLDEAPKRVVAQVSVAAALTDLGVDVVGTFGPLRRPDGSVDPQAEGLDPSQVVDLTGSEQGTVDIEKLASLDADIVVTNMYIKPGLWFLDDKTAADVQKLVPILAINYQGLDLVETLDAVEKVAGALGADLDAQATIAAHQSFDAATARLSSVGRQLGDRTIVTVVPSADSMYAADPEQLPDLAYYLREGLPLQDIDAKPDEIFQELSWEKSDTYDADIAMWDSRMGDATLDILKNQPVFGTTAAGKAGTYVPWAAVTPAGYKAYARVIDTLANNLEKNL